MPTIEELLKRGWRPETMARAGKDEPRDVQDLVEAARDRNNDRKKKAASRARILRETFHGDVLEQISRTFEDAQAAAQASRHVTTSVNLALDIVTAEACIYKQGVQRRIAKASPEQVGAFNKVLDEARVDVLYPQLNRMAAFVGPTLEVSWVRNGRLRKELYTADRHDVIVDPEDPLGPPIAASWVTRTRGLEVVHVLDQEALRQFGKNGDPFRDGDAKVVQLHGVKDEHGTPTFPGVHHRYTQPWDPDDWWIVEHEEGLRQATIKVAFLLTLMDWVRKTQNRRILYLFSNLQKFPNGQWFDPEVPVVSQVDAEEVGGGVKPDFGAVDVDVSPENFLKHVRFHVTTQAGRRGVTQVHADYAGEVVPQASLAMQHERLSQTRNMQKVFVRDFEWQAAWKAVALCHSLKHPKAAELPPVDVVRNTFEVVIPELHRMDDPKHFREQTDWEIGRGLTTTIEVELQRNPDQTVEEAQEKVEARLKLEADLNEFKTRAGGRTGLPVGAPNEDENQQFGAQGPEIRDGGKPGNNEDGKRNHSDDPDPDTTAG